MSRKKEIAWSEQEFLNKLSKCTKALLDCWNAMPEATRGDSKYIEPIFESHSAYESLLANHYPGRRIQGYGLGINRYRDRVATWEQCGSPVILTEDQFFQIMERDKPAKASPHS